MYSENFHSEDDYNPPHRKKPNGMATASVILGIVALSSITFPLSAVIFGALSILCALLSRTDRMPKRSIAGLILSLVSIAGSSFMVWRTVSYLQKNPQMLAYYQEMVHSILEEYGMSDVYDNLFGKYDSTYQLPQERKDDRENDQSETPSENSGTTQETTRMTTVLSSVISTATTLTTAQYLLHLNHQIHSVRLPRQCRPTIFPEVNLYETVKTTCTETGGPHKNAG